MINCSCSVMSGRAGVITRQRSSWRISRWGYRAVRRGSTGVPSFTTWLSYRCPRESSVCCACKKLAFMVQWGVAPSRCCTQSWDTLIYNGPFAHMKSRSPFQDPCSWSLCSGAFPPAHQLPREQWAPTGHQGGLGSILLLLSGPASFHRTSRDP